MKLTTNRLQRIHANEHESEISDFASIRVNSRPTLSDELFEKPYIPLIKQLNIVNSIFQHGDAFYAHAESEATDSLSVVPVVFDKFKNVGVDHAASQQLHPAAHLAQAASLASPL